jgi:hypothetical protein
VSLLSFSYEFSLSGAAPLPTLDKGWDNACTCVLHTCVHRHTHLANPKAAESGTRQQCSRKGEAAGQKRIPTGGEGTAQR